MTRRALSVVGIEDAGAFAALRDQWGDLLKSSAGCNPFLTWEWLYAWWMHFGGTDRLRLIEVRAGSQLVALAPLRLVSAPLDWFSRLEFLGTGEAGSDYIDVIVRRGREEDVVEALADYVASESLTLRLRHLPPASIAVQLARRLQSAGWVSCSADDGTCPFLDLRGHTFESFISTLGASHRANVRRRLRALKGRFDVRLHRVAQHAERRSALAALAKFHAQRYANRGGSTAFSSPVAQAFHEEATWRALDDGWLRMYVLTLNSQTAAVMYCFSHGGRFFFYQHGYDPVFASHSVGLVLMALTIEAAIDEGASEFDLLWGTESYKSLWARHSRVLQRVELYPLHLGGSMQRHAVAARRSVAGLARRVLALGTAGASRVG
jgi:CelD/BcsL family acetyltransferase involved in cellulose biosynthesis